MARRSGGEGCLGIIVLALAGAAALLPFLIMVAAFGGAAALMVQWVRALSLAGSLPEAPARNAFGLSATEEHALVAARLSLGKAEGALQSLRARGAHLSTRKDGRFNEASKLGKELNPLITAQERALYSAQCAVEELVALPETRRDRYCGALGQFRAVSWSVAVMIVVANGVMLLDSVNIQALVSTVDASALPGAPPVSSMTAVVLPLLVGMAVGWLFNLAATSAFTSGIRKRLDALPEAPVTTVSTYAAALPPWISAPT